jgi:hypothetical protein
MNASRVRLSLSSVLNLAVVFAAIGCSAPPAEETATDEAPLIANAVSIVRRSDGNWDVVCQGGTTQIVTTAQILANDVCTAAPVTCVASCNARWANGTCQQFGPDYCASGATCTAHVIERWSNGTAKTYASDYCVAGQGTCIPHCAARWSNGTCKAYDADVCGTAPIACVPRVVERWSNGVAKTYGPDFCKQGAPAPACTARCVQRWSNGACQTYGADECH